MTKEELLDLFRRFIITTPDGRLVGDRENRYNPYIFSYTGKSSLVYTFPRKIRWSDGYQDSRDIFSDRQDAEGKKNKPVKEMEEFNHLMGYEFPFDHEVSIWLEDRELWLKLLKKNGLTYESIPKFEEKYKSMRKDRKYFKLVLEKRYFRLDLYDPIRHLNLEHDGSWCHIQEIDEARDEYLKTKFPTIHIERIQDYNKKDSESRMKLKKILDSYLEPSYLDPLVFRYDQEVIEQQLIEYQFDLEYIINYLERGYKLENIQNKLAIDLNRYLKNLKNLKTP